jgi:hypothetical protein
MFDHVSTSFAVPSVPQLSEGLLGSHIVSTDLDDGSFRGNLVCDSSRTGGVTPAHPAIRFDVPLDSVHVKVVKEGGTGGPVWDAQFTLGGAKELEADIKSVNGAQWEKICTPRGGIETYRADIEGTDSMGRNVKTHFTFSSDNNHVVEVPFRAMASRVPPSPMDKKPTVQIRPGDFNPLKYMPKKFL